MHEYYTIMTFYSVRFDSASNGGFSVTFTRFYAHLFSHNYVLPQVDIFSFSGINTSASIQVMTPTNSGVQSTLASRLLLVPVWRQHKEFHKQLAWSMSVQVILPHTYLLMSLCVYVFYHPYIMELLEILRYETLYYFHRLSILLLSFILISCYTYCTLHASILVHSNVLTHTFVPS